MFKSHSAQKILMLVGCSLLLVLLNLALIYPYFFQSQPGWIESIEVSFISLGRMWAQHFPHIFWNPAWYAGFPMRFSYVPMVPIGTALLGSIIQNYGQAYHIISGLGYALVPATLFFFIRFITKNNYVSLIGALVFSLAPSLGNIFENVRAAQGLFGEQSLPPWRMMVMVFYGEGPHTVSQVFLPIAGIFFIKSLEEVHLKFVVATSVFVALAALANPIGLWATGLLLFCILLVYTVYFGIARTYKQTVLTIVFSYLFVSFWYTPGFISSDLFAESGGLFKSFLNYFPWGMLGVLVLLGLILWLLKLIKSARIASLVLWFVFTFGVVWVFYTFNVELSPQARRYIPEMDMGFAAMVALVLSYVGARLRKRIGTYSHLVVAGVAGCLLLFATHNVWKASRWFTSVSNESKSLFAEQKMMDWLHQHISAGERVFVSSNYSFWLNVKSDMWQLKGGHWQASISDWEPHAGYQITSGKDGKSSVDWLKIFAIKYVVVSNVGSPVHYADYAAPKKFDGLLSEPAVILPPSEVVYEVPLKHGMAGPVMLSEVASLKKPSNAIDREAVSNYVSWIEKSPNKLKFNVVNNDRYEITGLLNQGEGVRVAMSFDRGFKAVDDRGNRLTITKDPLGFILIEPKESGEQTIVLTYGPTFDFYLGWIIFGCGVFGAARLLKHKNGAKKE